MSLLIGDCDNVVESCFCFCNQISVYIVSNYRMPCYPSIGDSYEVSEEDALEAVISDIVGEMFF